MHRSFLCLSLFLPVLLAACGVEAPRPALKPAPAAIVPPLSSVAVTLTVPQADIARLIDNASAMELADIKDQEVKCPFGRCRLDLTAFRTGAVQVTADDGRLAIRLPFRANATLTASGFLSFAKAQGDAEGIANATTILSITPGWKLHSQSSGRIELGNAHLRIGPLVTNAREMWDENGESLSKPVWRMLDGAIARIPLKPQAEALWSRAFEPIALGKGAWLVLKPQQVALMQPQIGHGAVALSLAVRARAQVLVQEQMPANPQAPLPEPVPLDRASDRFSVAVPLLLPYSRAEQLALAALERNPPHLAGMRLTFTALHILASATDMVVETRFCADPGWDVTGWFASCAHVYFRGQPQFDPGTQSFRVVNLNYDIASANLMGGILRRFASASFVHRLGQTLVFHESREIARLERDVRAQLAQPRGQIFTISADVQSFGAPSFAWTRDGFLAFFSATGKVRASFSL